MCYARKAKCAGIDASQLGQLKELDGKTVKREKMYVKLPLMHHALQGVVSKWL